MNDSWYADQEFKIFSQITPTLIDFLQFDPFSTSNHKCLVTGEDNLAIAKLVFLKRWMVVDDELENYCIKFDKLANSPYSPNQLIFLSGYGGSGKSTFMRYMQSARPEYEFSFIDFDHPKTEPERPGSLKRRLIREVEEIDTAEFQAMIVDLNSNRNKASDLFGSELQELHKALAYDRAKRIKHLKDWELQPVLYLYIFFLFRNCNTKKLNILVLDNLDSIGTDYLSEEVQLALAKMAKHLFKLANLGKKLPASALEVARSFRFVVCLRDVNYTIIDMQLKDNLGGYYGPFEFDPSSSLQKKIIERRLDNATGILERSPASEFKYPILEALNLLDRVLTVAVEDDFFLNRLAPVYNNNIKQINIALLKVVQQLQEQFETPSSKSFLNSLSRVLDQLKEGSHLYRVGFNGALLKLLIRENTSVLDQHRVYLLKARYQFDRGYCYHHRTLLTALTNIADNFHASNQNGLTFRTDFVNLWEIIEELGMVYPISEIFTAIEQCFNVHKSGWGCFLLIRGINPSERQPFSDELKILEDAGVDTEEPLSEDNNILKLSIDDIRHFTGIGIKLTPAGYSFIRYLLPTFEFYTVLADRNDAHDMWYKSGIFSLFQCGLLWNDDGEGCFLFEDYIKPTYELTKKHVALMKNFFNTVYEGEMGFNPERFILSNLAFRHRNYPDRRHLKGEFHIYTLVTTHIGYLENFRRYCTQIDKNRYHNERSIGSPTNANLAISHIIRNYAEMLKVVPTKKAKEHSSHFIKRAQKIIDSNGMDFSTTITLN